MEEEGAQPVRVTALLHGQHPRRAAREVVERRGLEVARVALAHVLALDERAQRRGVRGAGQPLRVVGVLAAGKPMTPVSASRAAPAATAARPREVRTASGASAAAATSTPTR